MRDLLPIILLLTVGTGVACASDVGDKEAGYSCSYREFRIAVPPEMRDQESFEARRRDSGISLIFWAGPGAANDPTAKIHVYHPCGNTVTCCVQAIPDSDVQDVADADWVFEISEGGEILERWWIPINKAVLSVLGSGLILHYFNPTADQVGAILAIRPDRSFRVVPWGICRRSAKSMPMPLLGRVLEIGLPQVLEVL